jgi:hypothetical protein
MSKYFNYIPSPPIPYTNAQDKLVVTITNGGNKKMKNNKERKELYFYKGKFHTELGLRKVLMDEKEISVYYGPFYNTDYYDYCYTKEELREKLHDDEYITDEEYNHFTKYLKQQVESHDFTVINEPLYGGEMTDCLTSPWNDCFQLILDERDDNHIQTEEDIMDDYGETLTDDEWNKYCNLPYEKQFTVAKRWKLKNLQ